MATSTPLQQLCINTIRTLAMDAVQTANSGHPGAPMALAPVAFTIWDRFLRHNPANPDWPNRDRFVVSNGHASMLLYGTLHLMGYGLSLDDIKNFRQLHGKCAGHPEYGLAPGVETTTGPLGQGAANSVGMALAEKWLTAYFNRDGHNIIDYKIFAILGDGCMMEGLSGEAASLAGHWGLNNLIWLYDNNRITIEGKTDLAFSEEVATRFLGYHWKVHHVNDANDLEALAHALTMARAETHAPSLIIVDSHIAFGAPTKQDTHGAHGEPLGEEEIRATKKVYGWDPDKKFYVPEEVQAYRSEVLAQGARLEAEWQKQFAAYAAAQPQLAEQFTRMQQRELPPNWEARLPSFPADAKGVASRESSGKVLNAIAAQVPWLLGGSADLAPSTKTLIKDAKSFQKHDYDGRNLHFGIREHAMAAILNGMSLSKLRPYGATFLVFSDYMRPSLRLAALMEQPTIYIFTHDSIGVGEDGPTHQPIEHLASLRAIPHLEVMRPADANEVTMAWQYIMAVRNRPVALVLTRQAIPTFDRTQYASAEGVLRGAYVLADCAGVPEVILMGTGSEVQLCVGAHAQLQKEGVRARVVSMPCWELFERQDAAYREAVLPRSVRARVAVEAGATFGWSRYVGRDDEGEIVGMRGYGASAPIKDLLKEFGLTVEHVVLAAKTVLARVKQ